MKLTYYCFEQPIEFTENSVNVLIIENSKMFRDILSMLLSESEGYDTELVLSDGKILSIEKYAEFAYSMNQFGSDLTMFSQYSVIYSEIQNVQQVIKALDFRIDDDLPINERIMEYMRLNRDLLGKRLFIFVGLKSYFSEEELKLFYKDIIAEKFDILLIEGHQYSYIIDI